MSWILPVAALVFAERVFPRSRAIGFLSGAVLMGYGTAVAIEPTLLPTVA